MVKFWDCFHYIIIFVMLCNEIGWHDLQIRQISGNFADWLANLPIGRLARLADWTEHIYICDNYYCRIFSITSRPFTTQNVERNKRGQLITGVYFQPEIYAQPLNVYFV